MVRNSPQQHETSGPSSPESMVFPAGVVRYPAGQAVGPLERGCFLHAVAEADLDVDLRQTPGVAPPGSIPRRVEVISDGRLAVVVSCFEEGLPRSDRCNRAAHKQVLQVLTNAKVKFKPFAFGAMVPTRGHVVDLLRADREATLRNGT